MEVTSRLTTQQTLMRGEINEVPDAVERLLQLGSVDIRKAAREIAESDPTHLLSIGRGSSDHACTYLKYASELILKRPMASIGPSVKSVYGVDMRCDNALSVSISQSGMSPDIVQMTRSVTQNGAHSLAITNNAASDLAGAASITLDLHAGPEKSVAATKTFVNSLVVCALLVAEIKRDHALISAIHELPNELSKAVDCDWLPIADLTGHESLLVVGRGLSAAIANEAALKFKETCLVHAESYSSAEVLHGPVSIVGNDYPILALAVGDAAEPSLAESADILAAKGAAVFATTEKVKRAKSLPSVRTSHWLTNPIALVTSFYSMVEQIAVAKGINPDKPRHLRKITETL
ncbi:MAG: SIS domain-containing protein [Pseudomonadota bacterium]